MRQRLLSGTAVGRTRVERVFTRPGAHDAERIVRVTLSPELWVRADQAVDRSLP